MNSTPNVPPWARISSAVCPAVLRIRSWMPSLADSSGLSDSWQALVWFAYGKQRVELDLATFCAGFSWVSVQKQLIGAR